jgi:hypothetical protein
VKDGNWNEDKFGIDLATKRVIPTLTYETEYSKNHINFRGYPQDPRASKIKFESADEIQTKIRLGLSYSILFSHGNKDKNDKVLFLFVFYNYNNSFCRIDILQSIKLPIMTKILQRRLVRR